MFGKLHVRAAEAPPALGPHIPLGIYRAVLRRTSSSRRSSVTGYTLIRTENLLYTISNERPPLNQKLLEIRHVPKRWIVWD